MSHIRLQLALSAILIAALGLSTGSPGVAGEATVAAVQATPLADVVVQDGGQTLRIRIVVSHGGEPWSRQVEATHRRHLESLFAQLDANRDGRLSSAEARRLPPPQSLAPSSEKSEVHVAFNFRVLDANGDGVATLAELGEYVSGFVGNPLGLKTIDRRPAAASGDLFDLLDEDRDRRLSGTECAAAAALWDRDRDGNRVLAGDELKRPTAALFGPEFVATPIGPRHAAGSVTLGPPQLDLPADATIVVDFPAGDAASTLGDGAAIRTTTETSRAPAVIVSDVGDQHVALNVGGLRVDLRVVPPAFRRERELMQAIIRQFDAAADPATRIVSKPAELPPLLKRIFPVADGNADGSLTRDELTGCVAGLVAMQHAAEGAQLRLSLHPLRRGPSALVDVNLDGRISGRELARLPAALTAALAGRDSVALNDLPEVATLVLQRGPFAENADAAALLDAGPPWFYRADRNHDGDLDAGEFLGPAEAFRRIDADGDGWIDLHEAIRGDRQAQLAVTKEVP